MNDFRAQRRVKAIVATLQKYIGSYDEQPDYLNYTDETIIEDVLYGLGIALDRDEYSNAIGYAKFKQFLRKHLSHDARSKHK